MYILIELKYTALNNFSSRERCIFLFGFECRSDHSLPENFQMQHKITTLRVLRPNRLELLIELREPIFVAASTQIICFREDL